MTKEQIKRWIKHPSQFISAVLVRYGKYLPDKIYLQLQYYNVFGRRLNLKNPETFNEKLQWLKLYDRNPEYTKMVDKVEVKKWVADRIGEKYIIPTLGVWECVEDIDFDLLPNQFVLKTNHDSGAVIICKDKSTLNIPQAREKLAKSLKRDYYKIGREWPYKNVKRRILAEKYMVDESGYELKDYKIFCFNGKPEFIQVDFDRFAESGHKRNLYSTNWFLLDFEYGYPSDVNHKIEKPNQLEEMIELASKISQGHIFLRVDFYSINLSSKFGETTFFPECGYGKFSPEGVDKELGDKLEIDMGGKLLNTNNVCGYNIYFGEMTFYPGCGYEKFTPEKWDFALGELIKLQ